MKEKTSDSITGWGIIALIVFILFALSSCSAEGTRGLSKAQEPDSVLVTPGKACQIADRFVMAKFPIESVSGFGDNDYQVQRLNTETFIVRGRYQELRPDNTWVPRSYEVAVRYDSLLEGFTFPYWVIPGRPMPTIDGTSNDLQLLIRPESNRRQD